MDTVNFPDGQLGLLFRSITLAVVQAVYDGKHDLAKNTAYAVGVRRKTCRSPTWHPKWNKHESWVAQTSCG